MFSHTVPKRLLEEFAYFDPITGSKRLWRYEFERRPYSGVSPSKATALEGYFADPEDEEKERQLEVDLAQKFEHPVNEFLFTVGDGDFLTTDERMRQLTFYVTLLFHRSAARRRASTHMQKVTQRAYDLFFQNRRQIENVAAKWSIDLLLSGRMKRGLITAEEVAAGVREGLAEHLNEASAQQSYLRTMERAMSEMDELVYGGEWRCLRSNAGDPFILSDAPVVTWERLDNGVFSYGQGFHRENVEVLLPVSPTKCLHILPNVQRTRSVRMPSTQEINVAQAAFAGRACYGGVESEAVDQLVQANFGKAELGVKAFTVWHRDYRTAIYDILMGQPDWAERTKR
jgi:hypothetical protein